MIRTPQINPTFLNEDWFVKLAPQVKNAYIHVLSKITASGRWKKDLQALRKFQLPEGPTSFLRIINADQPRIVEQGEYWYQAAPSQENSLF